MPFSRPGLPREWAQQPAKRQRIRDASNSNPFMARSVFARKPNQEPKTQNAILPTKDDNVYYRRGPSTTKSGGFNFAAWHQSSSTTQQQHQPLRNDLAGGSGVGAGSYTVQYGATEDIDNYEEEENESAAQATTRGRKRSYGPSKKRTASRTKGAKTTKKGKAKSKGGWGRGKRGGWGGRKGGRGRGSYQSSRGSPMESQSDAFLANVGGASITF